MTNLASPEEARLRALDEILEEWKDRFLEHLEDAEDPGSDGEIDDGYADRFAATLRRLVDLNDRLHPEDFDPAALAEIRNIIIKWIAELQTFDPERPLDSVDYYLVNAEAIRHLIRDALDAHVNGVGDDARAVIDALQHWLPGLTQTKLATLLGVTTRQIQRWKREGGPPTRRLRTVARLVAILRRAWTEEGVVAWFYRPRRELGGKAPVDVLGDAEYEEALGVAARQGRAQHGS
ncbi:MAG TPA: hypothetical protein VFN48_09820 [Solirubrobacteraceae bacterium]|nr:hypothetical protein [Solirubrobacteraceae bacterium]